MTVSVFWSQVFSATGYYVSYQRQDLGAPPVVTPQYERVVGGATTSVTLRGLEPGTTYRIRVWSTDGTSVSNGTREMDVATVESGEMCCENVYKRWNIPDSWSGNVLGLSWIFVYLCIIILYFSLSSMLSQHIII